MRFVIILLLMSMALALLDTCPVARRLAQKGSSTPVSLDAPSQAARVAGLRYVSDAMPGIRRRRVGRHFVYLGVDGRPIRDPAELRRIKALVIPPAWTDIWICPLAEGHLQATGRDAKGRKQYRYHARWRAMREETKYDRMLAFGQVLPHLRRHVEEHLSLSGLPREKVLATVVRLLDATFIRVGNEEYARTNRSFGLTTLRDHHVDITGGTLHFQFRGKGGKFHTIDVHNQRLARIVKRCQELPGYELFQYLDDSGQRRALNSTEVNSYLQEIAGQGFTAKDFRTWAGTILTAIALRDCEECTSAVQAKKNIVQAIAHVAARLGNTPAICRKCYVHPAVLEGYLAGSLQQILAQQLEPDGEASSPELSTEEAAVLRFLQQSLTPGFARQEAA